jgi:Zn-dependent peptidase ImmA (M78 family)
MVKQIAVKKEVLVWARKTAGYDEISSAAAALKISEEELKSLEDGIGHPTFTLFRKMVTTYRRAPTVMLIPSAPPIEPMPKDFRTKGGHKPNFSPETYFSIREARNTQQEISELLKDSPDLFPRLVLRNLTISDAIQNEAAQIRKDLGVPVAEQLSWIRADSFKYWRSRVQEWGILVLLKSMPVDDCRGFSLVGDDYIVPVIVINKKEGPEANSFTLFHELGHLLLRTEGICIGINREIEIERWCNDFAGSVLVPLEALSAVAREFKPNVKVDWKVSRIQTIARKLKVSKDVIALRLEYLKSAQSGLYEMITKSPRVNPPHKSEGFALPHQTAITELGTMTASIVLGALEKHLIDYDKATQILDINARWFSDLGTEVNKYRSRYNLRESKGD